MKAFIIYILLALFSININAEVKRVNDTFKVENTTKESDTKTKFTWEDKQGNKYPIYITKRGSCYIVRISKKTNKEYKQYLPKDIQTQIKKELNIKQYEILQSI